jgi:LPS-assembly lipoprotein
VLRKVVQLVAVSTLTLLLSACGFHLQTTNNLPKQLKTLYLTGNTPYSSFTQTLREQLASSGIRVVDSSKQAPFSLRVSNPRLSTSLTTLNTSQQTRDYTVTYSAGFSLESRSGKPVLPAFSLSTSTTQTMFSGQLLSNSSQLSITQQELERQLIQQLFLRLSAEDTTRAIEHYLKQHPNHQPLSAQEHA